jgi:hypothetical protein
MKRLIGLAFQHKAIAVIVVLLLLAGGIPAGKFLIRYVDRVYMRTVTAPQEADRAVYPLKSDFEKHKFHLQQEADAARLLAEEEAKKKAEEEAKKKAEEEAETARLLAEKAAKNKAEIARAASSNIGLDEVARKYIGRKDLICFYNIWEALADMGFSYVVTKDTPESEKQRAALGTVVVRKVNYYAFPEVSMSELQPGDIIDGKGHAQIYIGNGKSIHGGSVPPNYTTVTIARADRGKGYRVFRPKYGIDTTPHEWGDWLNVYNSQISEKNAAISGYEQTINNQKTQISDADRIIAAANIIVSDITGAYSEEEMARNREIIITQNNRKTQCQRIINENNQWVNDRRNEINTIQDKINRRIAH